MKQKDRFLIFADGACRRNPGPGGWAFLIASQDSVWEACGFEADTTNNKMELRALIEALRFVQKQNLTGRLEIHLDSQYVLSGCIAWIYAWKRRGWVTTDSEPVKNRELWQQVADLLDALKSSADFNWYYVPGHAGVPGNERVDSLAASEADGIEGPAYQGPRSAWAHGDLEGGLSRETYDPNRVSRPQQKTPVYYLSLIQGSVFRDATWPECEARVRGRAGARYKKVKSREEELQVLKSWGHVSKD
jgi:ribonuclease HI